MVLKEAVKTDKAPLPLPFFSQAIKCQGLVYCSGSIGVDPATSKLVEGSVADRTVHLPSLIHPGFTKKLTPIPGPIPQEPQRSPRGSRLIHRQRRQSERLPHQHGELRGHE